MPASPKNKTGTGTRGGANAKAKPKPQPKPFADVYERLRDLRLTKPYLRNVVLPAWWDDEAAATAAGRAEGLMILARHLGLDLAALRDGNGDLIPEVRPDVRFKKRVDADDDDLRLAERLAYQVGRHAALGVAATGELPADARRIRDDILDAEGTVWVGLDELLSYCWRVGVVVLHVSRFPTGAKKMQGMAMRANGVPVIVLTSERKPSGWLLFDLAHELGHICLGHVGEDGAIVDEVVDEGATDEEEKAANRFAVELLTGSSGTKVSAPDRWPSADELAKQAVALGKQKQTDPTHIVLNYAHTMSASSGNQFWGVANAALKLLEPDADAPHRVRVALEGKLDWSALPGDSSEFVARMTKLGPDD